MSKNSAIIFDNGSGLFKAGFSEDFAPFVSFPTIVGKAKNQNLMIGMDQKEFYVGNEAASKMSLLQISNPIVRGQIEDWTKMEQIWQHTYENELVIDPQEHPVLVTQQPLMTMKYNEKLAETFFETFRVDSYYSAISGVLALYASGKTTGIVLESGEGITHSIPIFEGFAIPYATIKLDIGGSDLTKYLINLFKDSGSNISENSYEEIFKLIKEKKCFVSFDFDSSVKEFQKNRSRELVSTLPDGTEIYLSDQSFKCPEVLFQPTKIEKDIYGIHEAIYQSIQKCNNAIRKDLYSSILISGGNTMFSGINNRLFKEISALAPSTMAIKTKAPQERKNSVWVGGSILTSIESFKHLWITAKDYKESGANVLFRKIF
jgi:actin